MSELVACPNFATKLKFGMFSDNSLLDEEKIKLIL